MGRLGNNLLFWQTLLSAELPARRANQIVDFLESNPLDPVAYLHSGAKLTDSERGRIARAHDRIVDKAHAAGIFVLPLDDFPARIESVSLPPPALFVWGDSDVLKMPSVAIVGTRNATTYGKAVAQKFAEALASEGVCIISGGAAGIDTAAHTGALAAGGKTVAVFATGVDECFPASNRPLFERIRKSGCLISQFALGSGSQDFKFLLRNDTIAAFSDAVLIVEAPVSSGALRTASAAADMNRPVFVVPGAIDLINFRGSHNLIRDGATLVDHPHQILDSLGFMPKRDTTEVRSPLSDEQSKIVDALIEGPMLPETIVERTGLDASRVLAELTMLEIEGYVIRDQGRFGRKP